ncbi:MAG TPA: PilZ domain-containing protein [Desulfuromonadales bacterium]|nr:PilZ domain-containing protein [Desulfuromonadales bacterium]
MKHILIGDEHEGLLSTLEVILKHWGYRVFATPRSSQVQAFLTETAPSLVIIGSQMLAASADELRDTLEAWCNNGEQPILVLAEGALSEQPQLPYETLNVPIDIFALFELIQRHVEKIPRKNLRLAINLPGVVHRGERSHLAEVLSLSMEGLFIKTSFRLQAGERLRVVIPLLGMKKELEIDSQVLYFIHPGPENNYMQGVGIAFTSLDEENLKDLQNFLESRFFGEISDSKHGPTGLAPEQLDNRVCPVTLKVVPPSQRRQQLR